MHEWFTAGARRNSTASAKQVNSAKLRCRASWLVADRCDRISTQSRCRRRHSGRGRRSRLRDHRLDPHEKSGADLRQSARPSGRALKDGDIVIMELAAGYRGYSAQIGSPVCIGEPPTQVRGFFDEIVLPGFKRMVDVARGGHHLNELVEAARFYRQKGVQSRPIHIHGIDFVSSEPHIFTDHVQAEEYEQVLQPGMVLVIEPNAVTADGQFGIFFGHTFIITEGEPECVDNYPWELTVVR